MKAPDKESSDKTSSPNSCNAYPKHNKLIIASRKKDTEKCRRYVEDYVKLGYIHLESNNYEEALNCFQKIAEIEPGNPKTFINIGYIYEKMDMLDSAKNVMKNRWK